MSTDAIRANLHSLREFISEAPTIGRAAGDAHRDLDEVMMAIGGESLEFDDHGSAPLPCPPEAGEWDAKTFRGWASMLLGISAAEAKDRTIGNLAGAVARLVPIDRGCEVAVDQPQPTRVATEGRWRYDWAEVRRAVGLADDAYPAAVVEVIQHRARAASRVRFALADIINDHGGECDPSRVSFASAWDMFESEVLPALLPAERMLGELWDAMGSIPGPAGDWVAALSAVRAEVRKAERTGAAGRFMRREVDSLNDLAAGDVTMDVVRERLAVKAAAWHRAATKTLAGQSADPEPTILSAGSAMLTSLWEALDYGSDDRGGWTEIVAAVRLLSGVRNEVARARRHINREAGELDGLAADESTSIGLRNRLASKAQSWRSFAAQLG